MLTIGLISDTHMPDRLRKLPAAIFDILSGVDLVLHAGDVGKLTVLDELSRIAPVVAVHGNDEEAETVAALPYHQLIHAEGKRIFLSHCHYPDRAEELESRKDDSWYPVLQRRADLGKAHGADIVIFGHSHIPMSVEYDGLWLINPGAIASGNHVMRQMVSTVARLTLGDEKSIEFFSLDGKPHYPNIDLDAGFDASYWNIYNESILEPAISFKEDFLKLIPDRNRDWHPVMDVLRPTLYPIWERQKQYLTVEDIVQALKEKPEFAERLATVPIFAERL